MRNCKTKRRSGFYFFSVLMLLLAFCIPVLAGVEEADGEYEVYPTPQEITYESGTTELTQEVDVICTDAIDSYTKDRIEKTLAVKGLKESAAPSASNTKLIVGVYGSGDAADAYSGQIGVDDAFFNGEYHFDAYALWISDGTIVVLGEDVDAAYYGVTTLKRIFEQIEGNDVRNLTVKDYGQVEFRGFIEGYYGNPWSNEDRIDLMQFGSEIKMNQYIYAPKDDPLHNARWRELYDEEDSDSDDSLTKIADLAQAGNESKCFFVYALHPFMNNPVNLSDSRYDEEIQVVQAKFEQVIRKAGVRQIAILEDDATGETAERVIRFLNDMQAWLEELQEEIPDLKTDILYCPTCYMSTTDAKMTAISEGVSDKIHIVVTGGKIWGEVSSEFSTAFFNGLNGNGKGRYPYMWVNWPCNDNTKDSQIMGGQNYILHTGVEPGSYEGIVLNPIQESESSKVGIFTASDYCWNIWQDASEGEQAWDDAFKYIDHMTAIETEESLALKEVAKHQISQKYPNQVVGKQVYFEESVELKPMLESFQEKMNAGTLVEADADELKEEFQKISEAADYYLEHGTNRRMAKQMTPFFGALRDMTRAGAYLLEAVKAELMGDNDSLWRNFSEAQAAYEQSGTYAFSYYGEGTMYGKAGVRYITPFTKNLMEYMSPKVLEIVNPEYEPQDFYTGTVSHSARYSVYQGSSLSNLTDGDDSTFVWFGQTAQKDDYVQMDLGEAKSVGSVRIAVGGTDGEDKWRTYHLEYSEDGQNWTKTEDYTGANSGMDNYRVDLNGALARYIKIVNNAATGKWVKFSDFSVYPVLKDMVYTNTEDAGWEEEHDTDVFSLLPKQEATLQPGEYVGLKLDRIHEIRMIDVKGTGMESLTVEKSSNAIEWKAKEAEGDARYIRLHNKTNSAVTFNLTKFEVNTNEIYPMDLYEKTLAGNVDTDTRYWMDGDLSTKAKYQSAPQEGNYITYDMGQEIELHSLKVYVLDTAYDYPRDAKIQISADNETWTDVITIGDGIENAKADESTKPVECPGGGWTHDTVNVAYAYAENADIPNIRARYVRLYFTAGYAHRWVELNEILVNGGEYIPSVIDPTFETNADLARGYEPQMLTDGDLTTSFRPDSKADGVLIYNVSDEKEIGRINILQSGNNVCDALVSVRTGENEWEELGRMDAGYSSFYTQNLDHVYAVKLEWTDTVPVIYEIITLTDPGTLAEDLQLKADAAKQEADRAEKDVNTARTEAKKAEEAVTGIDQKVKEAEAKAAAAKDKIEKLRAEVELKNLCAQKAEAEAEVAEKKAALAVCEAVLAKARAKQFQAQAQLLNGEEKRQMLQDANGKETEAGEKEAEAGRQQEAAKDKRIEQGQYQKEASDKQTELDQALKNDGNLPPGPGGDPNPNPNPNPNPDPVPAVKNFTVKGLKYNVLSAEKKTAAVAGPANKKTVKNVTIPASVSYQGVTYNVTEIKANAFKGCAKLAKAVIGKKVSKIGKSAFAQCKKLKNIEFKANVKVPKNAFKGAPQKAKVKIPAAIKKNKSKRKKFESMLKSAGLKKPVIK